MLILGSVVFDDRTGTHTAMKSGMLAAEAAFGALETARAAEAASESESEHDPLTAPGLDVSSYQTAFDNSWIAKELREVRNLRPSFHSKLGNWGGIMYSGVDSLLLKGRVPWTFHHPEEDYQATKPAK
jgi:electron-transferring-flavoprotein dehydrogenase